MQPIDLNLHFNEESFLQRSDLKNQFKIRNGIPFVLSRAGEFDCVCCIGQEIPVGENAGEIFFLGYSEELHFREELFIHVRDFTIHSYLDLPDSRGFEKIGWVYDKTEVLKNRNCFIYDTYRDGSSKRMLYCSYIKIEKNFINSIELPNLEFMKILAITIR